MKPNGVSVPIGVSVAIGVSSGLGISVGIGVKVRVNRAVGEERGVNVKVGVALGIGVREGSGVQVGGTAGVFVTNNATRVCVIAGPAATVLGVPFDLAIRQLTHRGLKSLSASQAVAAETCKRNPAAANRMMHTAKNLSLMILKKSSS